MTIEKSIHNLLRYNPTIRSALVYLYQLFFYLAKGDNLIPDGMKFIPDSFFGFHDKSPWNTDDNFLLAHKLPPAYKNTRSTSLPINIGYYLKDYIDYVTIGSSTAWNWQQGSTLQWIGSGPLLSFHKIEHNQIVSEWVNIETNERWTIPRECAATSPCGEMYCSYDFKRFGIGARGYGYNDINDKPKDFLPTDPISTLSIRRTNDDSIISDIQLQDAIDLTENHIAGYYFFSHALFSPDSRKLAFFLRIKTKNNAILTNLFIFDIFENNLRIKNTEDCSHLSWLNNNQLLAYCINPSNRSEGYHLIHFKDPKLTPVFHDLLSNDGHPFCCPSTNKIVTDTYPDKYRHQRLFSCNLKTHSLKEIARIKIPLKYRLDYRCDFHPRLNRSCNQICIDTIFKKKRGMMILPISWP